MDRGGEDLKKKKKKLATGTTIDNCETNSILIHN